MEMSCNSEDRTVIANKFAVMRWNGNRFVGNRRNGYRCISRNFLGIKWIGDRLACEPYIAGERWMGDCRIEAGISGRWSNYR